MFKKKDEYNRDRKYEDSKEKKIDFSSKNHSGSSSVLFKKKVEHPEHHSKEANILPKRVPLKEEDFNSKSYRKDQRSNDKLGKKDSKESH